jgi:hypothetical protein
VFKAAVKKQQAAVVQWLTVQGDKQGWSQQECEAALALMQQCMGCSSSSLHQYRQTLCRAEVLPVKLHSSSSSSSIIK